MDAGTGAGTRTAAALGAVAGVVFLTRLPFTIRTGAGTDADAWRLLLAGRAIADTGEFHTSRAPTYPLVELVAAGLAGAPWSVFATLTALIGAIGAAAVADLARTMRIRAWWLPAAGYAMTPVVFRNDVTFLDFTWSTAFLLVALALTARGSLTLSGTLFGLAVAARPITAILIAVPIVVLLQQRPSPLRWATFLAPAALISCAFYILPLLEFGPVFVTAVTAAIPFTQAASFASTGVWGTFGAAAIVGATAVAAHRLAVSRAELDADHRRWLTAAVAGIGVSAVAFALMPQEPAYLTAAVPLTWLALGILLPTVPIMVTAAAVGVSSFVAPGIGPAFGTTILQDHAQRVEELAYAQATTIELGRLPAGMVVIARTRMPLLLALQSREVLTAPGVDAPGRTIGIPQAVRLGSGPLLVYGENDIPATDLALPRSRLRAVPGTSAPELPIPGT